MAVIAVNSLVFAECVFGIVVKGGVMAGRACGYINHTCPAKKIVPGVADNKMPAYIVLWILRIRVAAFAPFPAPFRVSAVIRMPGDIRMAVHA